MRRLNKPTFAETQRYGIDRSHPLVQGLVGCWLFNEGGGNLVVDLSGKQNHGDIYGAAWAPGQGGPVLDFDGTDDCVDVGDITINGIDLTFSAWINVHQIGADQRCIIAKYSGNGPGTDSVFFRVNTDGAMDFWTEDSIGANGYKRTAVNTVVINTWYHVAVVYDYSTDDAKHYVDGTLRANSQLDEVLPKISDTITPITIGLRTRGIGGDDMDGTIDKVCIYNRALPPDQVYELYANPYAFIRKPQKVWFVPAGGATANPMLLMDHFAGGSLNG